MLFKLVHLQSIHYCNLQSCTSLEILLFFGLVIIIGKQARHCDGHTKLSWCSIVLVLLLGLIIVRGRCVTKVVLKLSIADFAFNCYIEVDHLQVIDNYEEIKRYRD